MNNSRRQHAQANQQDPTKANIKNIKSSIDALANVINAYRKEDKERKDDEKGWSRLTAKAVIAYTAITLFIFIINAYQAYLIRQNNIVSQRAFVAVLVPQLIMAKDPSKTKEFEKTVIVSIPLTNSGNTPTKRLQLFIKCAPSVEILPEPWALLQKEKIEHIPQVIGAHQQVLSQCGYTFDHIQKVRL